MTDLGIDSAEQYLARLDGSSPLDGELAALLDEFTNTETHFFRHPGRFELLRRVVLPELLAQRTSEAPLRILSAGCSSGEEPYSTIMTLLEAEPSWRRYGLEVVGCDINRQALQRAERGVYGRWTLRYTPEAMLRSYFAPVDDQPGRWTVAKRVSRHARFVHANLVDQALPTQLGRVGFDVIFCCNVMIYLTDEVVAALVERLCGMLAAQGFLFVGYTESLHARRSDFEPIWRDDYVVYRRKPSAPHPAAPPAAPLVEHPPRPATHLVGPRNGDSIPRSSEPITPARPAVDDEAVQARYQRAQAASRDDRHGQALHEVEQILATCPFHVGARLLLAYLYGSQGGFWRAVAECTKALDIDPMFGQAYLLLGMLLEQQGETDSAIREIKRALYLDPELPLAHFNLGKLYAGTGNETAAARQFTNAVRLLELRPDRPVAGELPVEFDGRVLLALARRKLERSPS